MLSLRHAALAASLLAAIDTHAASLLDARVGDRFAVNGFDYAEAKRFTGDVWLKRIEVYAPSARIRAVTEHGLQDVPRSRLQVFISDGSRTASRLYLVVDPKQRRFTGGVLDDGRLLAIEGTLDAHGQPQVSKSLDSSEGLEPFECGNDTLPPLPADLQRLPSRSQTIAKTTGKGSGLVAAVVAIDTDNELMDLRFGDNTTTATDYLVNLFAGLNLVYERDLGVQLQQGDVILRLSSAPDPYSTTSASSGDVQLNEFAEYWRVNEQALDRAFALQISGKSGNNCSSAGIASILNGKFGSYTPAQNPPDGFDDDNYCNAKGFRLQGNSQTFGHFSLARVFKGGCGGATGSNAAQDVNLIGHELGHSFGARHAHCTAADGSSPLDNVATGTIDTCFNAEGTCYSGVVSCPNEQPYFVGQGSIMSYCNFGAPSGAACGQVIGRFHPAQTGFLDTRVADNTGYGCFTAVAASDVGPTLSANTPGSGSTTAMAGGSIGSTTSSNITFSVSGGSGSGTTQLSCSTSSGSVSVASGSPQSIAVAGSASPVVARFTLGATAQSGSVSCTATPQNGTASNFTYNFTAPAGTCSAGGDCVFQNGFE